MTSAQESKLNMYNAVISYSDASTAITATIAAYATVLTAFKAKVTALTTTAQLEAQVITGITINKADLKKSLCTTATATAAAVFAYASGIPDPILKEKANYSYTDLFKLKDDELPLIVQNIHDEANTVVASLTPFGVTAATLTAFQALITEYSTNVSAPRNAAAQRSAYKTQLKTLFKETDTILKTQLDKVAIQFKATQPGFYTTYKNNRIIIDAGASTTKAAGLITDSVTSMPISNVTITVDAQAYTTISKLDGSYNILIPVPGIYTLIFTKPGYTTQTLPNITITLGQTTVLNVVLSL